MWIAILALTATAGELPPLIDLLPDVPSFTTAKKRMYEIHKGQPTLYCGCAWTDKVVDLDSCGLGDQSGTRWERTEAEHIVPASEIGKHFECWADGRSHCLKTDQVYKAAHNDLHNLYPTVGQLNLYRSNNNVGLIAGEEHKWPHEWTCDFEIDLELDRFEPRPEARGIVARAYLYMESVHGVTILPKDRRTYLYWHQQYPPTDWEKDWNQAVYEKQGNLNPFVR